MKFLLVLALLIVAVAARRRQGFLDAKKKADFAKKFNVTDMENRKARLAKIRFRGQENATEIAKRRSEVKNMIPQKTDEDQHNGTGILDINDMAGISDYLHEGDISLTEEQLSQLESNSNAQSRKKRQVGTTITKWQAGIIWYEFDSSLNDRKIASATKAMNEIMIRTCLGFAPSTTAKNRIVLYNGSGCNSYVGMIGGAQPISIGDGCEQVGTITHEIMHALGIYHEQSRPDRDDFVTVDTSTVPVDMQSNFVKLAPGESVQYNPYEYGSVMQYQADAFSSTGNLTMIPKDTDYLFTLGGRHVSLYDYQMINKLYGCDTRCTTNNCKNGGIPRTNLCNVCFCPRGFGGDLCEERPIGCGGELSASTSWLSTTATVGNASDPNVKDDYSECNTWITSPAGTQIEIQITGMYNPQCMYGCPYNGLELKLDPTDVATGRRLCCSTDMGKTYTSKSNFVAIISYNSYVYSTFNIQYRYVAATATTPKSCPPDNSANCANLVASGLCTNPLYTDDDRKALCATSCNVC